MTLVINQLLDSKLTETVDEKEKIHEPTETQEEDTLVLWDCVSMFNVEDEEPTEEEEIPEANVTTRSHNSLKRINIYFPRFRSFRRT